MRRSPPLFEEMGEQGAAIAAVVGGDAVVDLWGGTVDADVAWSAPTRVNTYSVTKPLTAMAVLALVDARVLDLDEPVATYWPAYAQQDKGDTTLRAGAVRCRRGRRSTGQWAADLVEGRDELYRRALTVPPGALDPEVVNSNAWRQAEIPAVNGHATARAVAGFYAEMAAGGRGVVGQALLDEALTPQAEEVDLVLGRDVAWGLGPQIEGPEFGLGGIGGHDGYCNVDGQFGFGFVTRTLGGFERADLLGEAFEGCL